MTAHTRSAWFAREAPAFRGEAFYDADCALCSATAKRFGSVLAARGIVLVPFQSGQARQRFSLCPGEIPEEMKFVAAGGGEFGGAEAVARLCREIGWVWPVWAASRVPGVGAAMRGGYRWFAAHRHCAGGVCRMSQRKAAWPAWLGAALPVAAVPLGGVLPAWGWMAALSVAIFLALKWATWWRGPKGPAWKSVAYLAAWPGMDAKRFLIGVAARPGLDEWGAAAAKTTLGLAMVFLVARHVPQELVAAWVAMIGIGLALHCGVFHLASCAWRAAGADAAPLMEAPLLATSPSDFWGARWNRGFSDLARDLVVRPLRRAPGAAMLTVFALSGLVHELVISVPARGGWGLPTGYFLLQGAAVALERSAVGNRLGLGRGWVGRVFAWVVVAGPAFWLFHPPFVRAVVLPMLRAAGAL